MKARLLSLLAVVISLSLVLSLAAAAEVAPPSPGPASASHGMQPAVSGEQRPGAEALAVGASGLSYRYLQTIGTSDSPYFEDTAHLNSPYGLGTEGTNVWIVESSGIRALKYGADGAFLKQIGKAGASVNVGTNTDRISFDWLADVAVDSGGNVWVVNSYRQSIVKFDSNGGYLSKLGNGWGQGNDQFSNPTGIAFDSAGNIYVGDTGNHRVQVFDSSGSYRATIGVPGSPGIGSDKLNKPRRLAVDSDSRLYVADSANHRVQVFDVSNPDSPTYVATIGTSGEPGQNNAHFNWPEGVYADASRIYVADSKNNRVQIFDRATRNYQATIGSSTSAPGSGDYQLDFPTDVVVISGTIYVADQYNNRVQKFNASLARVGTIGTTGVPYLTDDSHFNQPTAVAVTDDGHFYLVESRGHRLLKLDSAGSVKWKVGQAGIPGSETLHLGSPYGVALDADGRVYVSDTWNNRVQIFTSDGDYFTTLGTGWGQGDCQFQDPRGIAIDADGFIYVADRENQRVQIFDKDLVRKYSLGQTGQWGTDNAHLSNPMGVAVDSVGTIYVADQNNHRVQVFKKAASGKPTYVRTIGLPGGNCGSNVRDFERFCGPAGVAVDSDGRVYVSDQFGGRVQVFDSAGAYLTTVGGGGGLSADQLRNGQGLAVDGAGNLWVADNGAHRVQKYARGVPNWVQSNINGFGNPAEVFPTALEPFKSYLYAGTYSNGWPAQVWRTADGRTWSEVTPSWPGDVTSGVLDIQPFGQYLYVGTANTKDGAEIWRTDGSTWQMVASKGFGSAQNTYVSSFAVFSNKIYAFTNNTANGLEIWRSPTGNSGSWTQVVTSGLGGGIQPDKTVEVYGSFLYLGLSRGYPNSTAELWRTSDGVKWSPVFTGGRGNANNSYVSAMAQFGNQLYIALQNVATGAEVWQSDDGVSWKSVATGGLGNVNNARPYGLDAVGNRLIVTIGNGMTGSEVWQSADGVKWEPISQKGWGDSSNNLAGQFDKGTAVFGDSLYVGTLNTAKGGQVWRYQYQWQLYLPSLER